MQNISQCKGFVKSLRRMFGDKAAKCRPLLSRDVADPWYSGDFAQTWEDILTGCTRILEECT